MGERAGEGNHRAGAVPDARAPAPEALEARIPPPEERVERVEHRRDRGERAARPEPATRKGALRATGRAHLRPEERRDPRELPVRDLVTEIARTASLLVRKEIELAKSEAREDLRTEIKTAGGLGVAGLCALLALQMLLVTIAFALQESGTIPGWLASVVIAAIILAIGTVAGLWGWAKRVRTPLDSTRRTIQENVRWARERIA